MAERRERLSAFRPVPFSTFHGKNESSAPQEVGKLELVRANNVYRRGNAFGTRPGFQYETVGFTGAIAGTPAIQGISEYRERASGGNIVVVAGGEVYNTNQTTTLTKVGVTISSGAANLWTFAEHKNRIYAAGGADGDEVWYWDGAAGSVTAVVFQNASAVDIDAKFIFEKWNYGFLGGMDGTAAEDNAMVARYSALNDMDTWPAGNTIGGSSAVGGLSSFGDERITGFGEFTDNKGDWLLILTNKRIYPVLQTPDPLTPFAIDATIQNGCVHQRAFVSLGLDSGEAIYLSEIGIHSIRQSQQHGNASDSFLSWKIRETFSTINRSAIDRACGAYDADNGLVIFAVPTGSNTAPDTLLVLDVRGISPITSETARWYIWTPQSSLTGNCLVSVRDTTGDRYIYMGDTAGRVVRAQDTTFGDLAAAYPVDWQTKHDDLGDSTSEKGLGDLFTVLATKNDTYNVLLTPHFDYGRRSGAPITIETETSGAEWGVAQWGVDSWASEDQFTIDRSYGRGKGLTVGFRFSHAGYDQPFWVAQFTPQLRLLGETTGAVE